MMEGYIRCPSCGSYTPEENLNCIFCGNPLPHRLGVFSGIRFGGKGILFVVIAVIVIASFLMLIL